MIHFVQYSWSLESRADTTSRSHHITDQINTLSNLKRLKTQDKRSSVYVERSEVDVRSTDFCNSCQGNVLLQSRNDILSEPACLKAQPSEIERENGRARVWDKIRRYSRDGERKRGRMGKRQETRKCDGWKEERYVSWRKMAGNDCRLVFVIGS